MDNKLFCPTCGQPVPPTFGSNAYGIGSLKGEVSYQSSQPRTKCPGCSANLVRIADEDSHWRKQRP